MAYNGRRGPNVSEYIANLNAIPTAQDLQNSEDNFNMEDSLAMFTNTQFFDFDLGHNADLEPNFTIDKDFGADAGETVAPESTEVKPLDFMSGKHLPSCLCSLLFCRCHCRFWSILTSSSARPAVQAVPPLWTLDAKMLHSDFHR
jgi:hypothetical protein